MSDPAFDSLAALDAHLLERCHAALSLEGGTLRLTQPPSAEVGDVSIACHAAAGRLKRKPPEVADELADALRGLDVVAETSSGRGFCNVRFHASVLVAATVRDALEGDAFGRSLEGDPQHWLLEYSGPNTNKPLHIGHLRNTILGSSLATIAGRYGHDVTRYNIVNDRGIHICKSMVAYAQFGEGSTPESAGVKGDQFVGSYYSRFASEAAAEFTRWADEHGAAELAALRARDGEAIARAADLDLRKQFLMERAAAGDELPFKPKKVKPALYPAKMAEADGLETSYQTWLGEHAAAQTEAQDREAAKRFQRESERRFESETSVLHADARSMLQKWEAGDEEVRALWRRMNDWVLAGLELTYQRLGVSFDEVDYESDVYLLGKDIVHGMVERGIARRREDGALVFDMPPTSKKETAQEKVLLRADGTSVYITQDLGSLLRRVERHAPDRLIWVVGSEQDLHFKTLFTLVDRHTEGLGRRCTHVSYGMVELPHGKMKSREGQIIEADEFLDDVHRAAADEIQARTDDLDGEALTERAEILALAAVKFHLLRFSKQSTVKFDAEDAVKMQGKTGPYCLYALARARSILRNLREAGHDVELSDAFDGTTLALEEIELFRRVGSYGSVVEQAVRDLEPYHLADYAHQLASAFHSYLTAPGESTRFRFSIVGCEDPQLRTLRAVLVRCVERALEDALFCLGIRTLDVM